MCFALPTPTTLVLSPDIEVFENALQLIEDPLSTPKSKLKKLLDGTDFSSELVFAADVERLRFAKDFEGGIYNAMNAESQWKYLPEGVKYARGRFAAGADPGLTIDFHYAIPNRELAAKLAETKNELFREALATAKQLEAVNSKLKPNVQSLILLGQNLKQQSSDKTTRLELKSPSAANVWKQLISCVGLVLEKQRQGPKRSQAQGQVDGAAYRLSQFPFGL